MIKKIKKLIEKIIADIPNEWTEELVPIHENPTPNEVTKIMYNSENGNARLLIDTTDGNYYVWDADGVLHHDVMYKLNISYKNALALIMYKSEEKEGFFDLEDTELDSVNTVFGRIDSDKLITKLSRLKFFKRFPIEYIWLEKGKVYIEEEFHQGG